MSELPILNGVLKYIKEKNTLFCMPGHKGGLGFLFTYEGNEFIKNMIEFDLTEVEGLDNLHHSSGIINESCNMLSRLYNSKKSYFLVNGSTSGNLSMIFAAFNEGDKILVERNCHRSIFNGIILRKLKPLYIKDIVYERYNAPLALDTENCLKLIRENKDAKGIVLTYPNYYGICSNLKEIVSEAKKYNMKVLVDSAHGAHFGISENLPENPLDIGADMVVMSAHKTLPSLTQTAFLHIGKESTVNMDKVDFYVSAFLSTSPSYLFLCSMDYSRFYLEKWGENHYNKLIQIADIYREKINKLDIFHVIGKEDIGILNKYYGSRDDLNDIDLTRYVINVEEGFSGNKLYDYLKEKGIQCEMSDSFNVICILSTFQGEKQLDKLYKVLKNCDKEVLRDSNNKSFKYKEINVQANLLPYEVMDRKYIWKNFKESEGKIAYDSIVFYPPGVPIIMPGEIINKEIIDSICYYKDEGTDILGLKKGKIRVVSEE
ncbi:aminotransferase class I/II-fold pyridoxal phosphate-dependent enzyme [Clostridium oceanicum]|uniref:Aminotransferase class V-fold PLP-dependent enzyme n=1 Tax=Clostridium oceanicum TaxID=1543 RepID=A0ABP3UWT7_9CLOT